MLFRKKTPLKSDEFEELTKKIVSLTGDIDVLKAKSASLETQIRSLRTKIYREVGEEESENSKNSDPFDWVRKNGAIR